MRIKKVVTALLLAVVVLGTLIVQVSASTEFPDVKSTDWFAEDVITLKNKGLIKGYQNGTFKPNREVTRAEALTIIWSTAQELDLKYAPLNPDSNFSDVDRSAWYGDAVNGLYRGAVINGYQDGTFKPDRSISRAEMAQVLAYSFKVSHAEKHPPFADVAMGQWYTRAVANLFESGITHGSNGEFKPFDKVTRAEMATFTVRAIEWTNGEEMPPYVPPVKPKPEPVKPNPGNNVTPRPPLDDEGLDKNGNYWGNYYAIGTYVRSNRTSTLYNPGQVSLKHLDTMMKIIMKDNPRLKGYKPHPFGNIDLF